MKIVRLIKIFIPLIALTMMSLALAEDLNTKLLKASENGQIKLFKKLVKQGANINTKSIKGNTPLMEAARWGRLVVVKYLIKKGVDKKIKNNKGKSAISFARDEGYYNIVKLLKKYKMKTISKSSNSKENKTIKETPRHPLADKFLTAASNGQDKLIKEYLSKGVNINVTNSDGNTALILAAKWGRTSIIKMLIKIGADRKIVNNNGFSALKIAYENNHRKSVKVLKKMTARLVATTKEYDSANN